MKVFLDVGAHRGQTLEAVLPLGFDRIHCFEPVPFNWSTIEHIADARTTLHKFGLSDAEKGAWIYDPTTMGASLWKRPGRKTDSVYCSFERASEWARANLRGSDKNYLKINAEGAECDILNDLADAEVLEAFTSVVVMWDAHKIPELHEMHALTRERMLSYPNVISSKQIPHGATHAERIRNWLTMVQL